MCVFFLAPKIRILGRKSVFSYGTAFFGKVALVTLGVGSVLAPSDLLCDFSFPSYARFREGNPADAPKSLPPPSQVPRPSCVVGEPDYPPSHCGGTVCQ